MPHTRIRGPVHTRVAHLGSRDMLLARERRDVSSSSLSGARQDGGLLERRSTVGLERRLLRRIPMRSTSARVYVSPYEEYLSAE